MNLSDLSKLDIKDIDVAKLKDKAVQHKEVVAQGVLVLTSIVVAIMLVNQSQFEIGQFKFKIATLQAKTIQCCRGEIPIDAELLFIPEGDLDKAGFDFDLLGDPAVHQLDERLDGFVAPNWSGHLGDAAEAVQDQAVTLFQHRSELGLQRGPKGILVLL